MKPKLLITSLAFATILLFSCKKEEESKTTINISTHIATKATDTEFEQGDKVGIYVVNYAGSGPGTFSSRGNHVDNAGFSYNSGQWQASEEIYWQDDKTKADFYCYYPYQEDISNVSMLRVAVNEDQGDIARYKASDFLWAKATAVSQMAAVPLSFSHRMSRLVINLVKGEDYEGDLPSDATVIVHNTVPKAVIDLSVGVVVKDDYAAAESIKAMKVSDNQYVALIVPQRLDTRRPLVEIISKGVSYLVERKFIFRQGIQHSINVILSDNPERTRIEIGGEIEGWAN